MHDENITDDLWRSTAGLSSPTYYSNVNLGAQFDNPSCWDVEIVRGRG